jgi:formylglycine-generating enzyme required for sulfatase activity
MAKSIFISYRREDAAADARSIYQRLKPKYGKRLFIDVDGIQPGFDFSVVLNQYLARSAVMLVVIGPRWYDARDGDGRRRLDDPNDFVRLEIAQALSRNIAVIPLLVGGARTPKAEGLPVDLQSLVRRQARSISHENFSRDMEAVEDDLRPLLREPWRLLAAGSVVAVAALGGWLIYSRGLQIENPAIQNPPIQNPPIQNPPSSPTPWKVGYVFRDCSICPEMTVVPAGTFMMGLPPNETGDPDESPQHRVTFGRQFAVGRFAVTFDEWDACVTAGGCNNWKPPDRGWGRGRRPVINVTWDDANSYVTWLSRRTGQSYRLINEAEREYVTRAGSSTPFWWGASISTDQANYDGNYIYGTGSKGESRKQTLPVDSFSPNPWALFQVHGNVWDWVEDCYNDSYVNAPTDGSTWTSGDCRRRAARGGAWDSGPAILRAANRGPFPRDGRFGGVSFRVRRAISE